MMLNRLVSVAPMMECTDRHDRYFLRLISPNALLYTEMVTTGALIHGDAERFLAFDGFEHPIALQLGGNDPQALATCARLGESAGYDEINLNVGCPSDRVKVGRIGACLMLEPQTVADGVHAMASAVKIPVTVKCRIGVDNHDSYEALCAFIQLVHQAGCTVFIIHARKAWLSGLSPKENREIPPLQYEVVWALKRDFPHLTFVLNGGLKTVADIAAQLPHVDGVMVGREAYSNPYILADIEQAFFSTPEQIATRFAVIEKFIPYLENQLAQGVKLSSITRHILGLFQGLPGARLWRRHLSENAHLANANVEVVRSALQHLETRDAIS